MGDRKPTSVLLDPELKNRIPRAMSISDAVEEALRMWLDLPGGAQAPSDQNAVYHSMLEAILTRGTDRQRVGIQSNLEAFAARLPHPADLPITSGAERKRKAT